MQWDVDVFEQEVRDCSYFKDHGFTFVGRVVSKPGTDQERHEVTLRNASTDRSLKVTFAPPRSDGRTAVSQVKIVKTSTDDSFNVKHYVKQYHGVDLGAQGTRYTDYGGTFQERVRAYLDFVTALLAKYLEPILTGREWPAVDFDWGGYR
jgi:hypothetical protein